MIICHQNDDFDAALSSVCCQVGFWPLRNLSDFVYVLFALLFVFLLV